MSGPLINLLKSFGIMTDDRPRARWLGVLAGAYGVKRAASTLECRQVYMADGAPMICTRPKGHGGDHKGRPPRSTRETRHLSDEARMVDHAVLLQPLRAGRLKRDPGDTLCGRVAADRMADVGGDQLVNGERLDTPQCPKCQEMAGRLGVKVGYGEEAAR